MDGFGGWQMRNGFRYVVLVYQRPAHVFTVNVLV